MWVEYALGQQGQEVLAASGRSVPSLKAVAESPAFLDPSDPPANSKVFVDALSQMHQLPVTANWSEVEGLHRRHPRGALLRPDRPGRRDEAVLQGDRRQVLSAALDVEGVSRRFGGVEALRELSLSVAPGELVAVLGASGSGKSTLLRTIAGLEPADAGRVLIDGADQARVEPSRRGVAMVFQSFALFPHLTVERNIAFGLRARSEPRAVIDERVRETADALRLDGLLDRRPGELSGGERQRVALARALAARPRVLLLDEPLSNLDAQLRVSTRAEIRRVQAQTGVTTLHVTHDQGEALALGHRVAVLRDGRVEQLGTPDDVWERPASTWVARFVGTPPMNLLPADGDGRIASGRASAPRTPCAAWRRRRVRVRAGRAHRSRAAVAPARGDEPIAVRAPEGVEAPAPGARVEVTVPPERLRRFDAASGRAPR